VRGNNLREKMPIGNILLVILSGGLFWAMTEYRLWLLIWVCFIPAGLALRKAGKKRPVQAVLLMVLYVLLLNAFSFPWFVRYTWKLPALSFALMTLAGLAQILFGLLPLRKTLEILVPPLVWTALTYLFSSHFLHNSWLDISFFQPLSAPLVWLVGGTGITFLIILTNWMAALGLYYRDRRLVAAALFLLCVPAVTSIYSSSGRVEGRPVKVALVQGNFAQPWNWRKDNVNTIVERYENLTLRAAGERPDIVIWPEYAVQADLFRDPVLMERISGLAKRAGSWLVIGTVTFLDEGKTDYAARRTDTVLVFSPEGELTARYDSVNPIPFDTMVVPGEKPAIVETPHGSFTIGSCYEEYSNLESFKADSDFIVLVVNNQRFNRTKGIELAALFSRKRAVENRKYVLRAANTGVTHVIDPYGKVVERLEPFTRDVLITEIYL
jgi:apolipoprotein N-acyltransferase